MEIVELYKKIDKQLIEFVRAEMFGSPEFESVAKIHSLLNKEINKFENEK